MSTVRVLLADAPSPSVSRLARALQKNGLHVDRANDLTTALALYAQHPPDVVLVGEALESPTRWGLCKTLKAHDPAAVSLALVPDVRAQRAAERAGADTAVIRPATASSLTATLRALALVRGLRLAQAGSEGPTFDAATGFYAFEHFKQALFVEVKRAKRYQLPFALVLASISSGARDPDPELRGVLMGGLALAVRQATRDTDLPVAYGDDHVMILLPHTDLAGAEAVAKRILFRVARSPLRMRGRKVSAHLSLGVAASPDGTHPFSALVVQAQARLKEARARGGSCLVAA